MRMLASAMLVVLAATGQEKLQTARECERNGDWLGAVEALESVRQSAPTDPEVAWELGTAYRQLSQWAFERMKKAQPHGARVYQLLGEGYAIQGQNQDAIRAYQNAISADPKLAGSHLALAMIYARGGDREQARQEIAQELSVAPHSAVALALRERLK